jgi:transposase-like protein
MAGTAASERVEIATRGERRSYSTEQKVRLVAETLQPGETVTAARHLHEPAAPLAARRTGRGAEPAGGEAASAAGAPDPA